MPPLPPASRPPPAGVTRTVEFEFDVLLDTALDVAAEMVEDLALTPEDAAVIAGAIRNELELLSDLPEVCGCWGLMG